MIFRKIFAFLISLPSICFPVSFTFGESIECRNYDELVGEVLANEGECVNNIEGEKVYLKPENIFPAKEGVFLKLDHFSLVRLPSLYSDEKGCYILAFEP